MRQLWVLLISQLLLAAFPSTIFASKSLTFTTDKNTLQNDQEMIITASPSGFSAGEKLFVKGAFVKEGSTNYFGLTKNNDSWIKNSSKTTEQRQVTVGEWNNQIIVKADSNDSGFTESGIYKFKVGFYSINSSGEPSSVNWSETVAAIALVKATSTLVPSHTPTTIPTQRPTKIPSQVPSKKPTNIPTQTLPVTNISQKVEFENILENEAPMISEVNIQTETATQAMVLGDYSLTTPASSSTNQPANKILTNPMMSRSPDYNVFIALIGISLVTGLGAIGSFYYILRKKQLQTP